MLTRRHALASAAALAGLAAVPVRAATASSIRIGYQKNGVLLLAKQQGAIEKKLEPLGVSVTWTEFQFGPPLLEALGLGSIDFGTTGDSPPIFAQAAGAKLLYVAAQPAAGSGAGILLPKGSTIQSLAELKGKRVAFAKASSAHNLTIAALQKAGLTYADIEPVFLPPADARAAFSTGKVDAWTIWDPFFAVAESGEGVRVLALASDIVAQNSFFLGNRAYTEANPTIIKAVIEELQAVATWAADHRPEVAEAWSQATGVDLAAQQRAVARTDFAVTPVTDKIAAEQQAVADRFLSLGLIPKPIAVRDIVWNLPAGA
ncbi:MAG: sulfonate ABC transporter substrate-binding protein [Geminicoccaceae bacterium]